MPTCPNQLLERMKSTIGVAVGNMEEAIKAGTIWCPSSQENVVANTPKKVIKCPVAAVPALAMSCTQSKQFLCLPVRKNCPTALTLTTKIMTPVCQSRKLFAVLETTVGKKTVQKTSLSLAHYVVESAMSTARQKIRILVQSTVIVV
jgi:hypothetical protein